MFIRSARGAAYRKKEALIGVEPMIEAYVLRAFKERDSSFCFDA